MARKQTMAEYYRESQFNPGFIALQSAETWQSHIAKRANLYEHHLGIPLGLLAGKSILEFGCSSGENALVLAAHGANLTLVEPNEQVLPRLRDLFQQYQLEEQIISLINAGVDDYHDEATYDLVIAEGFLFTLPNREAVLRKLGKWIKPGGLGIISFNDRYGCLPEYVKKFVLQRACQLEGAAIDSQRSLSLAQQFFGEAFARLNASRSFETWWRDNFANQYLNFEYLWDYPSLVPLIDDMGCQVYNTSPDWLLIDHFNWYKNVRDTTARHTALLQNWQQVFAYILTGLPPGTYPAPDETVIDVTRSLIHAISGYLEAPDVGLKAIEFPRPLADYLMSLQDPHLSQFVAELTQLFEATHTDKLENLLDAYRRSELLSQLWGTPYHYISLKKLHQT